MQRWALTVIVVAAALAAAGCGNPANERMTLAVIGDTPYGPEQIAAFPRRPRTSASGAGPNTSTGCQADLAWLQRTFAVAERDGARGIVVGMHGDGFADDRRGWKLSTRAWRNSPRPSTARSCCCRVTPTSTRWTGRWPGQAT